MSKQTLNNHDSGSIFRGKLNSNYTELYQNKCNLSTGILTGGELTINADSTSVDISSGIAIFVDNADSENPIFTKVTIGGNVVILNISSQNITYLGYDVNGIIQQATPFTSTQRRTIASIGAAIHTNRSTITFVNSIISYINDIPIQLYDVAYAIDRMNMDGNVFFANGANLKIDKTEGEIFKVGVDGAENPFYKILESLTAITFQYRLQNGTVTATTDLIDPANYDLNGVLTPTDSNKFTIQRICIFQSNAVRIQYGQKQYDTLEDAKHGITNDDFIVEANIAQNGFLRCHLIIKQGTTSLLDTAKVQFVEVNKYGFVAGSVGAALTNINIINALGYTPANQSTFQTFCTDLNDPTGFPTISTTGKTDRISSVLSFDNTSKILTLAPATSSFSYYIAGVKHTISSPLTCNLTDTEGWHGFYIDATDNILKETLIFTDNFILKNVAVAQGYWNKDNQELLLGICDERHGMKDSQCHLQFHDFIGSQLDSGGGLSNFTIGDGSNTDHAKFTVDIATFADEDLEFTSTETTTTIQCLYRIADGVWRKNTNSGYAFLTTGSGRIAYRNNSYNLIESTVGKFVCLHIYITSTNTTLGQIFSILGSAEYDTINDAIVGASNEIKLLSRGHLPINEEVLLGTVIFESGDYTAGAKVVQIVTPEENLNYIDWRENKIGYIPENILNKVTAFQTTPDHSHYPSEKLVKDYVDNLNLGLIWQEPVELINLTGSTTTWIAEKDYDSYILDTGGATEFNSHGYSFNDGDIVQSQDGAYVKIKTLAVNDRFVIEGVGTTTPVGIGATKKNYIATCTNATPSSLAFSYVEAENNDALYVQNANAYYNNVTYTYSGTLSKWVQLSAGVSLTYGNGLKVTGNVLNFGNLTATWNQTGIFDINHSGTYNGLTLTKQGIGFTIEGGVTSKTLTVSNTANVSGTNSGDVTLATNSGLAFSSGQTLLEIGTPSSITTISTNSVTTNTHTHAITGFATGTGTATGTNTGDETSITIGALLNNSTEKTIPIDADMVGLMDSNATNLLKKLSWSNIKATLKSYFDSLYTAKNNAISGATKTKITYDSKGLVTSGADATTADIADSTNKRYQTDAQNTANDATSSIQTQLNGKEPTITSDLVTKFWSGLKTWRDLNTDIGSWWTTAKTQAQTFSNSITFSAANIQNGVKILGGVISPTQITGNVDNYNPTGLATCNVMRILTNGNRTMSGLTAQESGRLIVIINLSTSGGNLILSNESANSLAANRFTSTGNITIAAGATRQIWYDGVTSRWQIL